MSAKSPRKSIPLSLEPTLYAALAAYARRRGARSLASAARLAIRAHLADEPAPQLSSFPIPRVRPLRLQLEPELRQALAARGLRCEEALRRFLTPGDAA